MDGVLELTPVLGSAAACAALGMWRGQPGRRRDQQICADFVGPRQRRAPARSPLQLAPQEVEVMLNLLNGERFADTAPAAVYATLLDEGTYVGSVRTMYRALAAAGGTQERRHQLIHPAYTKPELLAQGPREVWTWDISAP